ncbi:MAG: phage portal protein [Sulfuriferula sp.]
MGLKTWITGMFASDGDRSPWGSFWFEPVTVGTMSGMRVSSETAMQLSAVFRAVCLLSGHMAMLPIVFYERDTRKRVKHPLLTLLNRRPNRWQNAFEWREMIQGHLELRGNAYNEIIANARGDITELIPRHPDRVKVEMLDNGEYRYRITGPGGSERILPRGQIWHIRGLSSNGITGVSVIEYARESFGLGLAAQGYGARFFANDAKPSGGWIEFPGQFKDKEARQIFREGWQSNQGGGNRGKTAVLELGMKYHEIGINNTDAQFLETKKFSISDIARWFGVPPHKIGDLDNATFSNIEQQALEYIQDALQPRATRLEASIAAELLFDDEEIDIEFDFRELLRGDSSARATYYHNGILDGWMTRNEARDMEGMEPLDGLDEPLRPLNMTEEDEAEDLESDQEATEPPAQEQLEQQNDTTEQDASDTAQRLHNIIQSNAARMARRIVKSGAAINPELVAEAMGISTVSATAWANSVPAGSTTEQITASLMTLGETA